jgi:hypothetical protein
MRRHLVTTAATISQPASATMPVTTAITPTASFSAAAPFPLDRGRSQALGKDVCLGSSATAHLSPNLDRFIERRIIGPQFPGPPNTILHLRRIIGGDSCGYGD